MIPPLKLKNDDEGNLADFGEASLQSDGETIQLASGKWHYIKRSVPWIVGCSILAYLVWSLDFYAFVDALARADVTRYILVLIVYVLLNFLVDAQNLYALLSLSHNGIPFRDSITIRGASYLLTIIDYNLGMGSVVYYLKQYKNILITFGTGLMIYSSFITHISLKLTALLGYIFTLDTPSPMLDKIALICAIWLAIDLMFIVFYKFIRSKPYFKKFKKFTFVKIFMDSPIRAYTLNIMYRCVFYFTSILFFFFAVKAFQMEIPFMAMMAYVPAILFVISIPISAFGLGTSQAAMLFLFKNYGSPSQILAFSLAYSASIILARGVVGAYYYSIITKRLSYKPKTGMTQESVP
ncbi:MAG: flippase-like domain-containing protein [Spirochaetes bacterium]|nr:flippase-like domain-containing protein [Spirochaetota bacterium]